MDVIVNGARAAMLYGFTARALHCPRGQGGTVALPSAFRLIVMTTTCLRSSARGDGAVEETRSPLHYTTLHYSAECDLHPHQVPALPLSLRSITERRHPAGKAARVASTRSTRLPPDPPFSKNENNKNKQIASSSSRVCLSTWGYYCPLPLSAQHSAGPAPRRF